MAKTILSTLLVIPAIVLLSSCNHSSGPKSHKEAEIKYVTDSLEAGDPFRLCRQKLTSFDALMGITDTTSHSYDREKTPLQDAFYFPDEDMKDFEPAVLFGRRYNMAAVMNHVIQSYELFCRKSSSFEPDEDNGKGMTKADTLALIAEDNIPIPSDVLARALPDAKDRQAAMAFLRSYDRFDGKSDEGSRLDLAFNTYRKYFSKVPSAVSEELSEEYMEKHWNWYDKKQFVDEIDRIQLMRLNRSDYPSDDQIEHFRQVVESERDIDRRAILALEYWEWDRWNGAVLLGEILESGQYTRYLPEIWVTWRASVQYDYIGPSSFTVIPNNYYDQMRVKCMDTILRHMKSDPDKFDACILEELLSKEILHRQGSLMGNESMAVLAALSYGMYVHPRVMEQLEH